MITGPRPGPACRVLLLLLAPLAATGARAAPPQFLDDYQACLVTESEQIPVRLEHAVTPEQRRLGLMERSPLPDNGGMLFWYREQRAASAGFWMYRTRIPLDIAWLDEDGVILARDTIPPCKTDSAGNCPSWSPGVPHHRVLEMNAGFFDEHHVAVGDELLADLNDNKPCPAAD